MKVFIQWATDPLSLTPEIIDSSDWPNLPKKREPTDTSVIDGVKGWIHGISVFGRSHKADHVAIEENPTGHPAGSIKVTHWDDDPADRTSAEFHAKSFIYEPIKLSRTKFMSQQFTEIWITDRMKNAMEQSGELPMFTQNHPVKVHAWADFVKPPEAVTLHGIWESDDNNRQMTEIDHPGYRESI